MIEVLDLYSNPYLICINDIAMIRELPKAIEGQDTTEITYKQGAVVYLDMDMELLLSQISQLEEIAH